MPDADAAIREANRRSFDAELMFRPVTAEELREEVRTAFEKPKAAVLPLHGRDGVERPEVKKEAAWHRQAAYLIAQGMTQRQVAEATGKSVASVNLVFAQRWFQEMVVQIIHEERVEDGAFKLLSNAAAGAAMTVIELASGAGGGSPAVRLKASEIILSRVLGPVGKEKPAGAGAGEADTTELESVDKQIKELEAQKSIL